MIWTALLNLRTASLVNGKSARSAAISIIDQGSKIQQYRWETACYISVRSPSGHVRCSSSILPKHCQGQREIKQSVRGSDHNIQ